MLQNPSSLYSAGQGILRDNVVDYITKLENHKRAKDEALDKYYQNLPATINEKGVRDQDIPGLHQKIGEVQQYWMENRDKIKKGNTPENFNYNRMWRDVKGGVTASQNDAGTGLKLGSWRGDAKKAYMFKGADKEEMIRRHELPVWDKDHVAISLPQFESVQPLDTKKHLEPLAAIKSNEEEPTYQPIPNDPLNRMEVRNKKYSPDDLSAVYVYSQERLNNDGGFEKALETAVQNPETATQLNDIFQKQFGRAAQSENDLAAAYTILLKGDAAPTYKKVPNELARKDYDYGIWKKKNAITFGQKKDMAALQHDYAKALKFGYENKWLEDSFKNLEDNPVEVIEYRPASGGDYKVKKLGVSSSFKKAAFEDTGMGVVPDDVVQYPNGDIGGLFYEREPKYLTKEDEAAKKENPKYGEIKKTTDGKNSIDESIKPIRIPRKQAMIYYGKSISSGKDLTGELSPEEQRVIEEKTKEKSSSRQTKKEKISW